MNKLVCYGAGEVFNLVLKKLDSEAVELVAVIDKQSGKPYTTSVCEHRRTLAPNSIKNINFDYVLICSDNYSDEMYNTLKELSVTDEKILFYNVGFLRCCDRSIGDMVNKVNTNIQLLNKISKKMYHEGERLILRTNLVLSEQTQLSLADLVLKYDYVRVGTFELIAQQIHFHNYQGDIAEIGVYRGDSAQILNELFPERNLYLFDTFNGFDDSDATVELAMTNCDEKQLQLFTSLFVDTSEELVLSKMKYRNRIIIKKGYFPDTAVDLDEDIYFALVHIDLDLYQPVAEALKWSYQRIKYGGYIVVHDYFAPTKNGVSKAVNEFICENKLVIVPIPDVCGSIIITKQVQF